MSSGQKVIKYLAIAFAIFLIVNIVSGVFFGISIFFGTFLGISFEEQQTYSSSEEMEKIEEIPDFDSIRTIEIKAGISKLKIEEGENFTVTIKQRDNQVEINKEKETLKIESKGNKKWRKIIPSEIIVSIPKEKEFENIELETGIGEAKINSLFTKNLDLKIGVGNVFLSGIQVSQKAKIQGGVGVTNIQQARFNELELKAGVGDFDLSAELTGDSDIDGGVGNLNLNLLGKSENYQIKSKTGLGNIRINDQKQENKAKIGQGEVFVSITGGIGNIIVKTSDAL